MKQKLGPWLAEHFSRILLARPFSILIIALVLAGLAASIASRIKLDTGFAALLPENAREVREVDDLIEKAGGTTELIIAVSGKKRLAFGQKLVEALRAKPWIRRADVEFPIDFFMDRRLMLMPVKDLAHLRIAIDEEIERAKARANPFYVDLEEDAVKPWAEVDERQSLSEKKGLLKKTFTSPDGRYLFVRVKPQGTTFDMEAGRVVLERIKSVVDSVNPKANGVTIRYAGGLPLNQEQHQRMNSDLRRATWISLVLVIALITFYIRRIETLLLMVIPLISGVCITLAITELTIGQLNLVSGFLVTALIGLGVDFEIHLYLRYLEKLPTAKDRFEAMSLAIAGTLPGCWTGAATTAAAFFAMSISEFRGFREYGQIAGLGVLVTLATAYIMLPPLALMLTRKARVPRKNLLATKGGFPRQLAWAMVIIGGALFVFSVVVSPNVRFHNNFHKLRGKSELANFSAYVDDILGGSLAPAAILVDNIEQAYQVEKLIEPRTKDPNSGVRRVFSLASMIPQKLDKRRPILKKMETSLVKVLEEEELGKDDRKRIEDALKMVRISPWTVRDIPDVFRRQFMTLKEDSTFVLVWPRLAMHEDREVIAWGDELGEIQAELNKKGIAAPILDQNRVAGRVLKQMKHDSPYVLAYAGCAVLLLLILDFRSPRKVFLVSGSLAVGIFWLLGVMYLYGLEINVFNQAIIPTVLGMGIDNAVHLQHRYSQEGLGSLPFVVSTTGGASFLASATTVIGFGTAITAYHAGIQSMGWLAIAAFTCAFIATTVFFPALLRIMESR